MVTEQLQTTINKVLIELNETHAQFSNGLEMYQNKRDSNRAGKHGNISR
jgi:hypothetical protein